MRDRLLLWHWLANRFSRLCQLGHVTMIPECIVLQLLQNVRAKFQQMIREGNAMKRSMCRSNTCNRQTTIPAYASIPTLQNGIAFLYPREPQTFHPELLLFLLIVCLFTGVLELAAVQVDSFWMFSQFLHIE